MELLLFLLVFYLVVPTVGGIVASNKSRCVLCWVIACFLFPLMVLVILVLPKVEPASKTCPECAETVLADAKVCKHCGYRFAGPTPCTPADPPARRVVPRGAGGAVSPLSTRPSFAEPPKPKPRPTAEAE